jgi:hypothetical protein
MELDDSDDLVADCLAIAMRSDTDNDVLETLNEEDLYPI